MKFDATQFIACNTAKLHANNNTYVVCLLFDRNTQLVKVILVLTALVVSPSHIYFWLGITFSCLICFSIVFITCTSYEHTQTSSFEYTFPRSNTHFLIHKHTHTNETICKWRELYRIDLNVRTKCRAIHTKWLWFTQYKGRFCVFVQSPPKHKPENTGKNHGHLAKVNIHFDVDAQCFSHTTYNATHRIHTDATCQCVRCNILGMLNTMQLHDHATDA